MALKNIITSSTESTDGIFDTFLGLAILSMTGGFPNVTEYRRLIDEITILTVDQLLLFKVSKFKYSFNSSEEISEGHFSK
jgi:hypothetical protein